jgi:mono/diheme cytochrome c family protein
MVSLKVNGLSVEANATPDTPLLWVLRDHLGLTGTKFGCGIGQCGACTVHLDGNPVRSCVPPISAAKGEITTIEAVGETPAGKRVQADKETGIGPWTDAQLVSYLSTGYAPGHGAASGSMRQAIDLSLSRLPATDIEAIVTYLRSVTPRRADAAAAVMPVSAAVKTSTAWSPGGEANDGTGRRIFEGACASCHAWNGNGQQVARAGLAGSHAVNDPLGANLIRVILEGTSAPDHAAATAMPSFGAAYTDAEIAAVANYAIGHFGGKQGQVTAKNVAAPRP